MALWNAAAYAPEDPVAQEELVSYSYEKNLRADANFAPSFSGFHFEGVEQCGPGLAPMGSGADRFGVEDGGKRCRFWYDHLMMIKGKPGRIITDRGCSWTVLKPQRHGATYRDIPASQNGDVVKVSDAQVVDGMDVVVFEVVPTAVGETIVVLHAKEPGWFLEESRDKRSQDAKLERAQRKKDAVLRAKKAQAMRLIYGDDVPPPEDVHAHGEPEIPPLWGESEECDFCVRVTKTNDRCCTLRAGRALRNELTAYEGIFSIELHFKVVARSTVTPTNKAPAAHVLKPIEKYALEADSTSSDSDAE